MGACVVGPGTAGITGAKRRRLRARKAVGYEHEKPSAERRHPQVRHDHPQAWRDHAQARRDHAQGRRDTVLDASACGHC